MTTEQMKHNPFGIPDLSPMLSSITEYVKSKQGEKGFINTDNTEFDTIYSIEYANAEGIAHEYHVKAVRVNEHGRLEVLTDVYNCHFSDDDIRKAGEEEGTWMDIQYDDNLYFIPTIFNIAESIREYCE